MGFDSIPIDSIERVEGPRFRAAPRDHEGRVFGGQIALDY